jgi:homoserine dehydrogenase
VSIKDFTTFDSGYAANGKQYMVGHARLEQLKAWAATDGVGIILTPNGKFLPRPPVSQNGQAAVVTKI